MSEDAPPPLSVDDFTREWSDDEQARLARWSQGDLIAGLPILWAERTHSDTPRETSHHTEEDWEVSQSEERLGWAAITSQTCDVGGDGPGSRHPFVQLSPVASLASFTVEAVEAVRNHRRVDMVLLTSPPGPGNWAVDLRVSLPISKESLLVRSPVRGFSTEGDLLQFAEHLSIKFNRPALHSSLSEELPASLKNWIRTQRKSKPEWWQKVRELRLHVESGTRLDPLKARLLVVETSTLEPAEREVWREWTKSFNKQLRKTSEAKMLMPVFASLDSLSARLYAESSLITETVFPQ